MYFICRRLIRSFLFCSMFSWPSYMLENHYVKMQIISAFTEHNLISKVNMGWILNLKKKNWQFRIFLHFFFFLSKCFNDNNYFNSSSIYGSSKSLPILFSKITSANLISLMTSPHRKWHHFGGNSAAQTSASVWLSVDSVWISISVINIRSLNIISSHYCVNIQYFVWKGVKRVLKNRNESQFPWVQTWHQIHLTLMPCLSIIALKCVLLNASEEYFTFSHHVNSQQLTWCQISNIKYLHH